MFRMAFDWHNLRSGIGFGAYLTAVPNIFWEALGHVDPKGLNILLLRAHGSSKTPTHLGVVIRRQGNGEMIQ